MGKYDHLRVRWAKGEGRNFARAKHRETPWAKFCRDLSEPVVTPESRVQFDKMSKDEQDKLKAVGGWLSGAQFEGKYRNLKNILPRNVATIDFDYMPDDYPELIRAGLSWLSRFEGFWHSSRRHLPEKPRLRYIAPLARFVTKEEYGPLIRIIAWRLQGEPEICTWVDKVSARPAQMMFWPSVSKTDRPRFFAYREEGELLDPDEQFTWYEAKTGRSWTDLLNLPRFEGEENLREHAEKAEDPLEKMGPVGDFCRAHFPIESFIAEHLSDVYVPGDDASENPRYTYVGSTSSNGAVVYESKFLYSHHGHDPVCDTLVNAWDLYRIHRFGDEDVKTDPDTPMSQRPSYKAMLEHARTDPAFKQAVRDRRYDFSAAFGEIDEDDDVDDRPAAETGAPRDDASRAAGNAAADQPDDGEDEDPDDPLGFSDAPEAEQDADAAGSDGGEGDADDDGFPTSEDPFADIEPEDGGAEEAKPDRGARGSPRGSDNPTSREALRVARRSQKHRDRPPKDWVNRLEVDQNGTVKSITHNYRIILENDMRFRGRIGFNQLRGMTVLRYTVRSHIDLISDLVVSDTENGDPMEDRHDAVIKAILEAPSGLGGYGLKVSQLDLRDAIILTAELNRFHPIREYHAGLTWDGVPRLAAIGPTFLGTPDDAYHRDTFVALFVASVARIWRPGTKFDYALILQGEQGIRKSTFIEIMAKNKWYSELQGDFGNTQRMVEQILGFQILELGELASQRKSEADETKAFLSRTVDRVRLAYERRPANLPRQCVFVGSTNDKTYLKDPTGNRRFWPVEVTVSMIDTESFEAIVDQMWAEAVEIFFACAESGEPLPIWLRSREAQEIAKAKQAQAQVESSDAALAGQIAEWLSTPVPESILLANSPDQKTAARMQELDDDFDEPYVLRTVTCAAEVWTECLGRDFAHYSAQAATMISRAMHQIDGWSNRGKFRRFAGRWGRQRVFEAMDVGTEENLRRYRYTDSPHGNGGDDDSPHSNRRSDSPHGNGDDEISPDDIV